MDNKRWFTFTYDRIPAWIRTCQTCGQLKKMSELTKLVSGEWICGQCIKKLRKEAPK